MARDTPGHRPKAPKFCANVYHTMPSWEWALVALLAFGALQLLALRYALREEGPDLDGPGAAPFAVDAAVVDPGSGEDGVRRCPTCGAENRPGFTYCRDCVSYLAV